MPLIRRARGLALGLAVALPGALAAQSINCDATISDIDFGTVSLRSGIANETTGALTVSCTGIGTIGVCISLGAGSGGSGAGFSPRFMRRADNAALSYQLRPNANGPSGGIWEDVFIEVPVILGTGSTTVPIYADITASGQATGIGPYSSTFTTASDLRMSFNTNGCGQPGTDRAIDPFTVSAAVAASCEVDGATLDFGTIGAGATGNIDASTTFVVRCTQTTAYTVRLDNGTGAGATGPTDRRLTSASAQLRYGLYRDAARTQPWGEVPGTTSSGTGSGTDQGMTVHGRIFGGQPLIAGSYSDSVLITVEY